MGSILVKNFWRRTVTPHHQCPNPQITKTLDANAFYIIQQCFFNYLLLSHFFFFLALSLMLHFCFPLFQHTHLRSFMRSDCKSGHQVELPTACLLSTQKSVKLSNNISLHLNLGTHYRCARTHTTTVTLVLQPPCLTRKGNGFSPFGATQTRGAASLFQIAVSLKSPFIYEYGDEGLMQETRRGNLNKGRDQKLKRSLRFCILLVLVLPAPWPLAGFTYWIQQSVCVQQMRRYVQTQGHRRQVRK